MHYIKKYIFFSKTSTALKGQPASLTADVSSPEIPTNNLDSRTLYDKVAAQGEVVRKLKSEKAPKVSLLRKYIREWYVILL